MLKKIIVQLLIGSMCISGTWAASSTPQNVDVSVTVVGTVFSLDVQDSSGYPWSGQLSLGILEPGGEASFPPDGVLVAACKSNHLTQWEVQVQGTQMIDETSGLTMPEGSLQIRGYDSLRTGGEKLPGSLVTVPRPVDLEPVTIYTSNSDGDAGHNRGYGSYVPIGFGVKVPPAQQPGTYVSRVTLVMTE